MNKIPLIKSTFFNEKRTKKILLHFIEKAPTLSMGEQCKKFEEHFAQQQQRKYAVFVNSGSSANLILIQAFLNLGILKKGDRVGFSALTWSTNVMPLIQLGLTPVPIDCEYATLNVSSQTLHPHLNDIDALFLTNALGFCADIDEIARLCKQKNIPLLEDNCESLGSVTRKTLLGNFGIASTFSLYVGHHLSTIEGGVVCTDDKKLHEMLIMTRAHGWDRNLPPATQKKLRHKEHIEGFYGQYTFYDLGYNVRPTEINGVIGLEQLKYWNTIVKKRESNFQKLEKIINANKELMPLHTTHMDIISNFAIPIIAKTKVLAEKYKKKFIANNIEIRPIIAGNILEQPFMKKYLKKEYHCPNAEVIHENGFYCGNSPEYTSQELLRLSNLLKP